MKKTLVSALTTALVVGAASTTFAAANPFADVPADHWAYDAVSELTSKGVVNGFPDGTFRGNQNMTRYEMAQIVAKAMAKVNTPGVATSGTDKAMVDKLAAEFKDELANLGVRVDELEARMDNVKWSGFLRYEFKNRRPKDENEQRKQRVVFRLTPTVKINNQWTGHARIEASMSANAAMAATSASVKADSYNETYFKVDQAWVDGNVGKVGVKLGRFAVWSAADHGLTMDDAIVGAQVAVPFGNGWNFDAAVGRYQWTPVGGFVTVKDTDGNDVKVLAADGTLGYATYGFSYAGAELTYAKNKLDFGVAYRSFKGQSEKMDAAKSNYYAKVSDTKVLGAGIGYHFSPALYATVDYAHSTSAYEGDDKSSFKNSYNVQLNWQATKKIGLWLAYKKLSDSVLAPTYDLQTYSGNGQKGWEVGADIAFQKNVTGALRYFDGKQVTGDKHKEKMFYGNLTFKF